MLNVPQVVPPKQRAEKRFRCTTRIAGWHPSSEPRIHKHTNCQRLTFRMMQKKGAAQEILLSYDAVRKARGQVKSR